MIGKILAPVDGSVHANAAMDWASDLVTKYQARLALLHVMTEGGSGVVPEELREFARYEKIRITDRDVFKAVADKVLYAAEQRARVHGMEAIETVFGIGHPAKILVDCAKRLGVDPIVMGAAVWGACRDFLLVACRRRFCNWRISRA